MIDTTYSKIGCSQEDHLPHCSHFGYSGEYLSEHAPWCTTEGRTGPCICNPKARAEAITASVRPNKRPTGKRSEHRG